MQKAPTAREFTYDEIWRCERFITTVEHLLDRPPSALRGRSSSRWRGSCAARRSPTSRPSYQEALL
jgi:hypothetical protein